MRIVYVLAGLGNGRFTCQGFTDPQNGPDGDRRPSLYSSLPSLTPSDTVSEVTKDSLSRGGFASFCSMVLFYMFISVYIKYTARSRAYQSGRHLRVPTCFALLLST